MVVVKQLISVIAFRSICPSDAVKSLRSVLVFFNSYLMPMNVKDILSFTYICGVYKFDFHLLFLYVSLVVDATSFLFPIATLLAKGYWFT